MSAFHQTFPLVSGHNGCIQANLTGSDWGKEGTENLDLFHVLCHQVPSLLSNGPKLSRVFLPVCVLVTSFTVAFDRSCQKTYQLQVFIDFLYPILAKLNSISTLLDYLSLLQHLFRFLFYFSSIRSPLLLCPGLFPPLFISCLLGWTFSELEGGINQLSWTPFSRGLYPMIQYMIWYISAEGAVCIPESMLWFAFFPCILLPSSWTLHLVVSTARTTQNFYIERQFFFVFECEVNYSLLSPWSPGLGKFFLMHFR